MMRQKRWLPLMVMGLMMSAHAGDYAEEANPSNVFMGVHVSEAFVQGSHQTDLNYAARGIGYGVFVGADNGQWRTSLAANKMNNGEVSYEQGELLVNYMILMPAMQEAGLRPYIGLNGGYANYEAKGGYNENGFTYGGQTGLVYDLSDNIDIDLNYKYSIGAAASFDHVGNVGIGISYKY